MLRRSAVLAVLASSCAAPTGWAQQPIKVWRIGALLHNSTWANIFALLQNPLRELGYVEGRNLSILTRATEGHADRLDGLASDLVAAGVDLIIAPLNFEVHAAMRATRTIPILMMFASEPVSLGLIRSLARPGGNVTGTTTSTPTTSTKMVEALRDAVPGIKRLAFLAEPEYPGMAAHREQTERAARTLGIQDAYYAVRVLGDLEPSLNAIERERPDGLFVAMTGAILGNVDRVIAFAARLRLPALYSIKYPVKRGGLMSYSPDFDAMARRNAAMIDRVFKGTRPGDIPVEEPSRFELTINLKTARELGLTIPQSLLLRADDVIQ